MEQEKSIFDVLNAINCNEHTENKNGLTYLSWAWAWGILKKHYPKSFYTVYENKDGWNYHHDGRTAWVKVGVTAVYPTGEAEECVEYLPIMDYKNKSIPLESITSFDVNKAIQRCKVKAIGEHGLGLYIYAGEDLPDDVKKGFENILAEIEKCTSIEQLQALWNDNSALQKNESFIKRVTAKKAKLQ